MPMISGKRIVISVNLPHGLYEELQRELRESGEYVHMSDLIRTALRFYLDHKRQQRSRVMRMVVA